MMVRRTKLAFVGMALQQARHTRFLTLFGTLRAQMPFHSYVSRLVEFGGVLDFAFSFKNR